jgi:ABC-type uncharacterized transport system substrate-binding protein
VRRFRNAECGRGNGPRAIILLVLAFSVVAMPLAGKAQHAAIVRRIGFLSLRAGPTEREEAFRQGLRELGYAEGKDIAIDYRWAAGRVESLPGLAAQLVSLRVDLIVAVPTVAVLAARNATKVIPIIMLAALDPVETGIVASLARPGGNITGLAVISLDLVGKDLQLLKEIVPRASRFAALCEKGNPATARWRKEAERASRQLGMRLQILDARGPAEIESAFATMRHARMDAVLVQGTQTLFQNRQKIAQLAGEHHLPALYQESGFMDAGGLVSYGQSIPETYRHAATFVDKILKGAKPGDLPVEQPAKYELVINLKMARALGLTIPQSVLIRADEVIQ